jgi:hypothetical protein
MKQIFRDAAKGYREQAKQQPQRVSDKSQK